MNPAGNLGYDVFVNEPPPQDGFLPNGEPKRFPAHDGHRRDGAGEPEGTRTISGG